MGFPEGLGGAMAFTARSLGVRRRECPPRRSGRKEEKGGRKEEEKWGLQGDGEGTTGSERDVDMAVAMGESRGW